MSSTGEAIGIGPTSGTDSWDFLPHEQVQRAEGPPATFQVNDHSWSLGGQEDSEEVQVMGYSVDFCRLLSSLGAKAHKHWGSRTELGFKISILDCEKRLLQIELIEIHGGLELVQM